MHVQLPHDAVVAEDDVGDSNPIAHGVDADFGDPQPILLASSGHTSSRKLRDPVPPKGGVRQVRTDVQVQTTSHVAVPRVKSLLGIREVSASLATGADGSPITYVGIKRSMAHKNLPQLPVQESVSDLWLLTACWIGSAHIGNPRQQLRAILTALRDLLVTQLLTPTSWVGLSPGLKCPVTTQLCAEFGPVEFVRAVLGVTAFFMLLHHGSDTAGSFQLYRAVEELFVRWCELLGVDPLG